MDKIPEFSDSQIAEIIMDLYGLHGEIKPLVSFEDQNARIKTADGTFVLKMGNKRWPMDWLNLQTEALELLADRAPELKLPRVIHSKQDKTITMVDGFPVRLLTFIEGDILGPAEGDAIGAGGRSPKLCHNLGHFMGRFTVAMQGYEHVGADRPDDLWNLDNILLCKAYLPDVVLEEDRNRISKFYDHYEKNILPLVPTFRRSIIHGDANEQNILVASDDHDVITGLIDFGDLSMASTINELAITVAYALLGVDDIEPVAKAIIAGYEAEFPLTKTERDVLMALAAMRMVQSITMSSHSAKQSPDNEYITVSQKPARELLNKLEGLVITV